MRSGHLPERGGAHAPAEAISLAVLLGLRTLASGPEEMVRERQLRATDRAFAVRTAIVLIGIGFVDLLCARHTETWQLVLWSLCALIARLPLSHLQRRNERAGYAGVDRRTVLLHSCACGLIGLVWSVPALFFSAQATPVEMVALWTLVSCLMTAVAVSFNTTPASALAYLLPVGLSSIYLMTRQDDMLLPCVVATYTILLFVTTLRQAWQFGEQLAMDDRLAENREVLSLLLREHDRTGADWLWQVDDKGRLQGVSAPLAQLLGGSEHAFEGRKLVEVIAGVDSELDYPEPQVRVFADKLAAGEPFTDLIMPVSIQGERRWWEISATPRRDEKGRLVGFRGVGSDVTARQESSERIAQLARHDALTGLPNRLSLTEELTAALDQLERWNRPCGLMMIDLDGFKGVNDTLGHQIGDTLLVQVAERMQQACSANEMVGRLGGDEFAIVLREVPDNAYVESLARAIIASVSRPYLIDGQLIEIGASIGSARAPHDGRSVNGLMRGADIAMYRAKDSGGGRHVSFVPAMQADIEERRMLEAALRDALVQDQLHLAYQPVLDVATGKIVGFEALARWHHPILGNVPPEQFIPIAEEARLIGPIGDWVLRNACIEAMRWPPSVSVSINISPEQLRDPEFLETIVSALAHSGLPAHRLEIEVTETVFLRERSGTIQLLDKLGRLGIGLALDDFGTGHSSIALFSRTRIGTVKVDRAFVAGAARGQRESRAILGAAVAIARALGMKVVAEGVESRVEYDCVRAMGVDRAQGFHLGLPMPAEETYRLFGEMGSEVA